MTRAITDSLKLLADESRLRLLALLQEEELSVQELVTITGLGQSRVSHHLGLLRNAGVVTDRKEGTWTYYRLSSFANGSAVPEELWETVGSAFRVSPAAESDRQGLDEVRQARSQRSRQAHDSLAGVWRLVGQNLEKGSLRAEAMASLVAEDYVVADLGCGAGFFTGYLADRVSRVIAVDHSHAMLEEARKSIPSSASVEFRPGELDRLPLETGEVNGAIANLVLHHLADFEPVVGEIHRVLAPGGVAVVSDLRPHKEDWMRDEMGDLRLGIEPEEVATAFRAGGFTHVEEIPVDDRYRMRSEGGRNAYLELFLIRAVKGRRRTEHE